MGKRPGASAPFSLGALVEVLGLPELTKLIPF